MQRSTRSTCVKTAKNQTRRSTPHRSSAAVQSRHRRSFQTARRAPVVAATHTPTFASSRNQNVMFQPSRAMSAAAAAALTQDEIIEARKPVQLHSRHIKAENPTGKPPLVILHGLLGQANNWRNIATRPELHRDRDIYLLDLREHGASPHTSYFDYIALSNDVAHFIETHCPTKSANIIGHSMGGKTACALALLHPHMVAALTVVDILPIDYQDNSMDEIQAILKTVSECSFANGVDRRSLDLQLQKGIPDIAVRQWLLTNLSNVVPSEQNQNAILAWKPNVPTLLRCYDNVRGWDLGQRVWPYHGPTELILGGKSPFANAQTAHDIMVDFFPEVDVKVIADAGHWCHAEKPDTFVEYISDFIQQHDL